MTFDECLTFFQKTAHVIQSNPERGYITGEYSKLNLYMTNGLAYDYHLGESTVILGTLRMNFIPFFD